MATPKLAPKAGRLNMVIEQGATFNPVLTWKDASGAPVNLTGYTARMQVRPVVESSDVYLELTTENGGLTLGDSLGTIALYIAADATAAFDWTLAYYDLEMISGAGFVNRLLQGSISVSAEVTR